MSLSHSLRAAAGASGSDPYFKQNTLLLLGNGTDGEQNNTVLDESTNAHAITRYGNATQGSFSPFSRPEGYWSNYFDGNGDYLNVPVNSALRFGTGDFTVEAWIYLTGNTGTDGSGNRTASICSCYPASTLTSAWAFIILGDGSTTGTALILGTANGGSDSGGCTATYSFSKNTWYHVAAVRASGVYKLYVNGVSISYTGSISGTLDPAVIDPFQIGSSNNVSYRWFFPGFISNFRFVKGTAVYTGDSFTVPTSPLSAITNTSVLTCQSNRFKDNSANNFTLTPYGDLAVKPFSPLSNPSFFYDAPDPFTDGYFSNSFDGTGDWFRVGSTNGPVSWLNSSNAVGCIEAWIYPTAFRTGNANHSAPCIVGLGGTYFNFGINNGTLRFYWYDGAQKFVDSSVPVTLNAWSHVAVSFNGSGAGQLRIFINGVLVGTSTFTGIAWGTGSGGNNLYVGAEEYNSGTSAFLGAISNLRLVNGSALYTSSSFTPPTSPLTAISGTTLLTCQSNEIIDRSSNNFAITKYGDVTVQPFHPFVTEGYWSNYFRGAGAGDSLAVANSSEITIGTQPFWIEAWIYPTAAFDEGVIAQRRNYYNIGVGSWTFYLNVNAALVFVELQTPGNFAVVTANNSIPLNSWTHVAVSRDSSNVFRIYINGVSSATTTPTNTFNFSNTNPLYIGYNSDNRNDSFAGYISNFRMGIGSALYSGASSFTPPATPLTAVTNTKLLTCQSSIFKDNSTNNFAVTAAGSASVKSFGPFARTTASLSASKGGSLYLDGTGDYCTISDPNALLHIGSKNFTFEAWVYRTAAVGGVLFGRRVGTPGVYAGWTFGIESDGNPSLVSDDNGSGPWAIALYLYSPIKIPLNTWAHVAFTRNGSTWSTWVNGQLAETATTSFTAHNETSTISIGSFANGTGVFNGYISNLRFVLGTCLYTSTFTPPSTPLTPTNQTSLLLNFTNIGVVDSTGNNNFETVGNARISTAVKKFGTGSMYFDGTDDKVVSAYQTTQDLSSGDWTIEFWMNLGASVPTNYRSVCGASNGGGLVPKWIIMVNSTTSYTYSANKLMFASTISGTDRQLNVDYTWAANTWYHIAVTYSGGITRLYVNGALQGTMAYGIGSGITSGIAVGGDGEGFSYFTGYLDDFRITRGIARYTGNFTPPNQYDYTDPYAGSVVLALSGEAQNNNGAQNNTFVDSSTNQFPVTRYGNVTQGSFSPFGYNWSYYFDGNGDYLTLGSATGVTNQNFTMELWFYLDRLTYLTGSSVYGARLFTSGDAGRFEWGIRSESSSSTVPTAIGASAYGQGYNFNFEATGLTIPTNAWNHVAISRNGSSWAIWVNGTRVATYTNSFAFTNGQLYLGGYPSGSWQSWFPGFISNARYVSGAVVYDPSQSTITVPTSPLTAVANTNVLTCQSNRFRDSSSNNFSITRNGDVRVLNFSPFEASGYSVSNNGGSAYFDGNGDYLTLPSNQAFNVGSVDFTVEFWFYSLVAPSNYQRIFTVNGGSGTANESIIFELADTGISFGVMSGSTGYGSGAQSFTAGQWYHLALSRNGSTLRCFMNGALVSTVSFSGAVNFTSGAYLTLGAWPQSGSYSRYINGYISSVRFVKGTGLYTAAFTPSLTPLTNVSNTSALLNFTNAGLLDLSGKAIMETVGNAQVSTAIKKYGTGSAAFDGTDDSLKFPITPNVQFGSSDWTIEAWINITAHKDYNFIYSYGPPVEFYTRAGGYLALFLNDSDDLTSPIVNIQTTATISTGQWTHVAAVRNGSNFTLYINGVSSATATSSAAIASSATQPSVGNYASTAGAAYAFNGYIDDLVVTKGVCRYTSNFTPPNELDHTDPYYSDVVLALNGNGTNGAQNNSFADSSSNNFAITRYGNTTQGTFSPFGYNWSNYFDGSSFFNYSSNTAFAVGTGNFTIEFWMLVPVLPTTGQNYAICESQQPTTSASSDKFHMGFYYDSGNYYVYIGRHSTPNFCPAIVPNAAPNTWYHVAVQRSSGTISIYINGTSQSVASSTVFNGVSFGQNGFGVGAGSNTGSPNKFYGYLSNFRFVVGTALYSANFTPSTIPLTAVSGTQLLTCQSNSFKDNSANNFSTSTTGSPSVTNFAPFATGTEYSTGTNGGSGYFDGSGDYLNLASNSAFAAPGDFTFECWTYCTSSAAGRMIYLVNATNGLIIYTSSSKVVIRSFGVANLVTSSINLPVNEWAHIAAVRSGTTLSLFINGSRTNGGTATNSTSFAQGEARIGINETGFDPFTGYISNLRFVKGSAVYDPTQTTITVPTAPLTAITNTSLLLNFVNGNILDSTGKNAIETVGDAQISTATKKFGTGSLKFDGTGDYLSAPTNSAFQFGTGDFTVECWVYLNAVPGSGTYPNILQIGTNFYVNFRESGTVGLTNATTVYATTASALTTGTWYHLAVVRSSGSSKIYVDGVGGTAVSCTVDFAQGAAYVGGNSTYSLNGYIDDLRITRRAKYTGNFTPPAQYTSADPYYKNVVLHLSADALAGIGYGGAQNNSFADDSTNQFPVTRYGNTTQGTFSPFGYNWSNYFDGNGDYLSIASNSAFAFGTGDFTVECWFYPTSSDTTQSVYILDSTGGFGLVFEPDGSSTPSIKMVRRATAASAGDLVASYTITPNKWIHLVAVRSGSTASLFIDGSRVATGTSSIDYTVSGPVNIGAIATVGGYESNGYISNLRVVKGTAVYSPSSTTLTVPTAPLTAITNTSLLTCQSNRFKDNSSNNFAITPYGDTRVVNFNPFPVTGEYDKTVNGGSAYFDGNGDYLTVGTTTAFSGDYTIEFFYYPTSFASPCQIIGTTSTNSFDGVGVTTTGLIAIHRDGVVTDLASTDAARLFSWNHVLLTRSNSVERLWLNGVYQGQRTMGTPYLKFDAVGKNSYPGYEWYANGYISSVRLLTSALYTSNANINVPTAPLSPVSNTLYLLNFTNGAIVDSLGRNVIETVGDAKTGVVKKYGSTSLAFDGTGDYLVVNGPQSLLQLGSADFTIEFWVNFSSTASGQHIVSGYNGNNNANWAFYTTNSGTINYYLSSNGTSWNVASAVLISNVVINQWYHIALVRNGSMVLSYVNGTLSSSLTTTATIFNSGHPIYIGGIIPGYSFNGYLDDIRITRYAKYRGGFTVPTRQLPAR